MKTVDARGELCPKPLIMAKNALGEIEKNDSLKILIDNEMSMKNVRRYLEDNGMSVDIRQSGKVYEFLVNKTGEITDTPAEDYCRVDTDLPVTGNYVIAIQKDKMGAGSDELGDILMKAFINTLPEADKQPGKLVFVNSGITFALKDSPVLKTLKRMEQDGVGIYVCGTCLDYFNKKDELGVGVVSNMYEIVEALTSAAKVVYP